MTTRLFPLRRLVGLLLLPAALLAAAPERVGAQTTRSSEGRGWTTVRVAKWALVGVAAGFGVYALTQSREAEASYSDLKDICTVEPQRCQTQNGRYVDAEAERLFDRSLAYDRRSRIGIIRGQASLLGGVVLFIYDLRHTRGPRDIPYPTSSAALSAPSVGLGVRLSF